MKNPKQAPNVAREPNWVVAPIHPGEIIRQRFFEPLGQTQADFCKQHGIERSKFSRVLKGTQKITPETATELSGAFGMSAMFFMNLQSRHDLFLAEEKT